MNPTEFATNQLLRVSYVQQFNKRFEGVPPVLVVASTLAALQLLPILGSLGELLQNPAGWAAEKKETFFWYLRKYIGHLLPYDKELQKAKQGFLADFAKKQAAIPEVHDVLPARGMARDDVLALCKRLAGINEDYLAGTFSGSVYHGGMDGYTEFINAAMGMHQWTNPLHASQFGGVRKMEVEIIAMTLRMFNAPDGAVGSMTTGGTESILLAMKAAREHGKERGITRPEMVVGVTAHAAFDKAAHYFGLKIHHARMDPETTKIDMKHFRSLVNRNTVALVGSAPHFPHGVVDPITEIAALGKSRGIPVHVDACLGGFILPFMEKAGWDLDELFDFRVDGVTSISCDTHKFGFAPKGSSLIMYRDASMRRHQMHTNVNWPGGIYATPTISGSRVGNVVAGTWAAMMSHGEAGYVESTRQIVGAARYIAAELAKVKGIQVMGTPLGPVVGFRSDDFDIYRLLSKLTEKHWELNPLQYPASVHICCTLLHAVDDMKHSKRLVQDVKDAVEEIWPTRGLPASGGAAIYGTSQEIPDRTIIGDIAKAYFDAYYEVDPAKEADLDEKAG
eukprot:TRINITY_DN492_c0_g2_i3.p2 TRINITY_DN492_c0_g2~~TRINITY_DN492_c0_g2_i3.p2  ORF type:complete len:564 (+),score=283.73 TRINITY_DN492_c0_g2_i3:55-1746(+)